MEREPFALMARALIITADLEKGRFAAPFMNVVHYFEAGRLSESESDSGR